jgi:mRNA-degrading endonuclease RelE of RelBE toxin-antitoxin system
VIDTIEGDTPLAYYSAMIFIETPIFTKRLRELLSDDSYAAFQRQLAERPDMGDVIEGTGGIRKVRVASSGHGKRGGSRVIYYHFTSASQIALVLIYPKNEKDDLTADERKVLKQIIERWR